MKDMKKDDFIEEKMSSYTEGTSPDVDLSAAKRALREEKERRRSARRRGWIAFASACACLLLVVIVTIGMLPALRDSDEAMGPSGGSDQGESESSDPTRPVVFELSAAAHEAAGVGELIDTYGRKLQKLTNLGLSSAVTAEYTLYYVEGEAVLLGTELFYSQMGSRVTATVYTDLSGGTYRAAELGQYDALPSKNATYTFEKTFLNGEYVYLGNFMARGAEYCVSLQSSYENAFSSLMDYLV